LLAELERQGRLDDLRAITEAAIRPAVAELGETGYYYRFLAQLDRHPQALLELQAGDAFRSTRRIIKLQDKAARRHLAAALVEQRRRLVTHLVLAAFADLEGNPGRDADEVVVSDLIDCVVALFSTPASSDTLEALSVSARRSR
jgi:hypothetical protein